MTVKEYFGDWWKCMDENEVGNVLAKLTSLYGSTKVYPKFDEVFKAFRECDYNNLSVVILGQDPYFDGSATGLAFANRKGTEDLSPSLRVLKDCVCQHREIEDSFDCTLSSWAKQGVLLLNSSLTVEAGKPGSHYTLWLPFMLKFLHNLGERQTGIIYALLGGYAKSFRPHIGKFNDILACNHPAYYARTGEKMPNIFERIDELTMAKNGFKIKWV